MSISWRELSSNNRPRSVYVHVPFCRKRCGYCNFSIVAGRDHLIDDWLSAVSRELGPTCGSPHSVTTIYLGGGTPSRLPPQALKQLLQLLEAHFDLSPGGEFTIEVNPEDCSRALMDVIAASAINRVSLGIQGFTSDRLRLLDRDHRPSEVQTAVKRVRDTVERFSIDLIFGVPGDESSAVWQSELDEALATGAGHLSVYELTIEKGTSFWTRRYRGQSVAIASDELADRYEDTIRILDNAGMEHYEISSWARPGERSRHNQAYWRCDSNLALGPSAAGLIDRTRYTNWPSVHRYVREVNSGRPAVRESAVMSQQEWALDQIVFGLRQIEGVRLAEWRERTGQELTDVVSLALLESLITDGFLVRDEDAVRLTKRGIFFADDVCQRLLGD